MNDQEKRTLDTFKRVRDFDAANERLFAAGTLARVMFYLISGVIDELEGHASAEAAGRGAARQSTASKAVARVVIGEDLGILRRTARTMSSVAPGLEDQFRLPQKYDDQELLTAARAALNAAEPHKAEFLRREVPERLFQELAANIASFEAALTGQNTGREDSITAGASIDGAIERGMDALRQLDAIVRNKLHDNPALLVAWLSAKRIERAPRRNKKTPTTPNNPKQ